MNVKCLVKNSATLTGAMFTAHAAQVHVTLPTLSEFDKEVNAFMFPSLVSILLLLSYDHRMSTSSVHDFRGVSARWRYRAC